MRDQPDPVGFVAVEEPTGQQHVLRRRHTDGFDEPPCVINGIDEAQLGGRYTEFRTLASNTNVGRQSQTDPAADAGAFNRGNDRLGAFGEARHCV